MCNVILIGLVVVFGWVAKDTLIESQAEIDELNAEIEAIEREGLYSPSSFSIDIEHMFDERPV